MNPMIEASHHLGMDRANHLASRYKVTAQHVLQLYEHEYARLAQSARVRHYLDLLALNNTKGLLQDSSG